MSLQSKPRILAIPLGRKERAQGRVDGVSKGALGVHNLQSLAAELHQSATEGVFRYPQNWVLATRIAAGVMITLSLVHVMAVLLPALQNNGIALASTGWRLAGAGLGVALAVAVGALLVNLFPALQVTPKGLGISELFGWRRIAWDQLGTLRVLELPGGRYVMMLPVKGRTRPFTPAPMLRLLPLLAGASRNGERGVLITSGMKNYERLLQLVVAYMAHSAGYAVPAVEMFLDEDATMPMVQMALATDAAVTRLASRPQETTLDPYGVQQVDPGPVLTWSRIVPRQMLIALLPGMLLLVDLLVNTSARMLTAASLVWLLTIVSLGAIELPFIARLVQSVGDVMVGRGQYNRSVLAYLELQAPRAALVLLGALLVGLGLPDVLAYLCWFMGIMTTTMLLTRFVQRLYFLPVLPSLLAGVGAFIFQMSLLALAFVAQ